MSKNCIPKSKIVIESQIRGDIIFEENVLYLYDCFIADGIETEFNVVLPTNKVYPIIKFNRRDFFEYFYSQEDIRSLKIDKILE